MTEWWENIPGVGSDEDPGLLRRIAGIPFEDPRTGAGVLQGVTQGATFGFGDELQALAQSLTRQRADNTTPRTTDLARAIATNRAGGMSDDDPRMQELQSQYQRSLMRRGGDFLQNLVDPDTYGAERDPRLGMVRREFSRQSRETPGAVLAGEVVGGAPLMLLPGLGATRAATTARAAASPLGRAGITAGAAAAEGAGYAALSGLGASEAPDVLGRAHDAAGSALTGAVLGGGLSGAATAAPALARGLRSSAALNTLRHANVDARRIPDLTSRHLIDVADELRSRGANVWRNNLQAGAAAEGMRRDAGRSIGDIVSQMDEAVTRVPEAVPVTPSTGARSASLPTPPEARRAPASPPPLPERFADPNDVMSLVDDPNPGLLGDDPVEYLSYYDHSTGRVVTPEGPITTISSDIDELERIADIWNVPPEKRRFRQWLGVDGDGRTPSSAAADAVGTAPRGRRAVAPPAAAADAVGTAPGGRRAPAALAPPATPPAAAPDGIGFADTVAAPGPSRSSQSVAARSGPVTPAPGGESLLDRIAGQVARRVDGLDPISGRARDRVRALGERYLEEGGGVLSPGNLHKMQINMRRLQRGFGRQNRPIPEQAMEAGRGEIRGILDEIAGSALGKEAQEGYRSANRQYAVGQLAREGTRVAKERALNNRAISLTDMIAAGAAGVATANPLVAAGGLLANRALRGRERALMSAAQRGAARAVEGAGAIGGSALQPRVTGILAGTALPSRTSPAATSQDYDWGVDLDAESEGAIDDAFGASPSSPAPTPAAPPRDYDWGVDVDDEDRRRLEAAFSGE